MKRNILLSILLGLGLSACNKDDSVRPDTEIINENIVSIKGEEYDIEFVITTIALISNISASDLYYDKVTHSLKIKHSTMELPLDLFSYDLNRLKKGEKL